MTWDVALILGIDGMANGAVYLLAGLGLVLIFSVTRVVFVPFGDVAAFSALSLAAFETGKRPATIGLVLSLAQPHFSRIETQEERARQGRNSRHWSQSPRLKRL